MAYLSRILEFRSGNPEDHLRTTAAVKSCGFIVGDAVQPALPLYRALMAQAGILAYLDVFAGWALLTFTLVPVTLLFSPATVAGAAAPRRMPELTRHYVMLVR